MSSVVSREPSRIDEPEANAVQCERFFEGVPGGAGGVRNDGPVLFQRRSALSRVDFAPVRRAENGDGNPFSNGATSGEAVEQLGDAVEQAGDMVLSVTIAVCKLDVFLAEVELQFHEGRVLDEGFSESAIDLVD